MRLMHMEIRVRDLHEAVHFVGHADPGSLHHCGVSGEAACPGTSKGVAAKGVDWSATSGVRAAAAIRVAAGPSAYA